MARPRLIAAYKEQIASYIKFKYGCDDEKAAKIAYDICARNYKPLTAILEETKTDGKPIIKGVDLASWFDQNSENIMTPSGSVYCQHEKKLGTIIDMLVKFLAKRKVEKKAMLKAKADGDTTAYQKHYYAQTLIKIFINALPGNFGSAYSLFYDKGNYNAITSSGRALIKYAYSMIEAVLGGNFKWTSIDELRIHIIAQIHHGIDEEKVNDVMKEYGLIRVSKEKLYEFYKKTLLIYNRYNDYREEIKENDEEEEESDDKKKVEQFFVYNGYEEGEFAKIQQLVSKMTDAQVQYFYYFENFRHIIMENDGYFRKFINDLFNYDLIPQKDEAKPDELFKVDGALVTMINVAFHKYLDPGDSKVQVYDLPKERPDLAIRFVHIARYVDAKLKTMNDLFDLFIYTPLCRQDVMHQELLYRNTAVVSDTDSVIFTVKDWVQWYTGSVYSIDEPAYHISMLMIYWITNAVAHTLYKYSTANGAKGKYAKVIAMKNEFLYPVMIQADVKKHYAGVITVQEGVILPEPDIDIKGGQLRGSTVPKVAIKFVEELISKDILDGIYKHGRISAHKVVDKVRAFEEQIYQDIKDGGIGWYKTQAIKNKNDYPEPMSSAWYYYYAWQEIFAKKYGDLMLPIKVPIVPIEVPNESYWSWIKDVDKTIGKRFIEFLDKNKRSPSYIAINTISGKVPKELVPLIKVKDIIHNSVKPVHLILRQLPINCSFEDKNSLFTEIYPVIKGKK